MITGSYHPEITGGGLQCRNLIRACDNSDERFAVITTTLDRKLKYRDTVDNIPVYRLEVFPGNRLLTMLSWIVRLPWLARRVTTRADIVHLHGFSSKSYIFIALAKHYGKRIVMKITSLGEDDPQAVFSAGGMQKTFYKFVDHFVVPSEALAESCRKAGVKNFALIHNGVDTGKFVPAGGDKKILRQKLGLPPDGLIVIFVGHFSQDKRPAFAARAWSNVQSPAERVHLLMIGARDRAKYEIDAEEIRTVDEVAKLCSLPGELILVENTDRIEDYYRSADIYLSTSVREGQPNALLEAMACGLACVQTKLPGITDSLLEDCGELFKVDNEIDLGKALKKLTENKDLREVKGNKAREKVLTSHLSITDTAQSYENLWGQSPVGKACPSTKINLLPYNRPPLPRQILIDFLLPGYFRSVS